MPLTDSFQSLNSLSRNPTINKTLHAAYMIKCLRKNFVHSLNLSTFTPISTSPHHLNHPILPLLQHVQTQQLDFRILHAHTITSNLIQDPFTYSRLIEFCFKTQSPKHAQLIFNSLPHPDLYTWNAMILGHIKHESPLLSIAHFVKMLEDGINPSNYTFALVLKACFKSNDIRLCEMMHGQIMRYGVEDFIVIRNSLMNMYCNVGCMVEARLLFDKGLCLDLISWNCMITGYGKCGMVQAARDLFDEMPERNLVSWGAMIDGYVMNGGFSEALKVFDDMQVAGVEPDAMTLVCVLKASGNLGALDKGKWVHDYIDKKNLGWERNVVLGTALVDMYAKSGCIDVALELFGAVLRKDVVLWNAMISGLAMHGHGSDALGLFSEMRMQGITPNPTTYVTVLSACGHGGMVEKGIEIFESMKEYGIEPGSEHYGCLADILGRAGRVYEAERVLLAMPMAPHASQWGALMAACRTYSNIEVGERVGKRLISLEPQDGGRYILLSNIYAAAGRWEDARDVRREMDQRGAKKETGCSFIEKDGILHEFISGDTTHQCSRDIYEMLDDLEMEMKNSGYGDMDLSSVI